MSNTASQTQPLLTSWEIDFLLERASQVVDDYAAAEHAKCSGVPAEVCRQMLLAKHRHVIEAARWVLEQPSTSSG